MDTKFPQVKNKLCFLVIYFNNFNQVKSITSSSILDVFKVFEKEGEFFCFAGQSNQAVTGMFNLYRASQLAFPREEILKNAQKFSSKYLQHKQEKGELLDKWIIMKDLPGEVRYMYNKTRNTQITIGSKKHYICTYALNAILGSSDGEGKRQSVFGSFLLIFVFYFAC